MMQKPFSPELAAGGKDIDVTETETETDTPPGALLEESFVQYRIVEH
jgi:hypothetical protein